MNSTYKNNALTCRVEDGQLVFRIGIDTLAWASKKRNGGPLANEIGIRDKAEWAKDVANALMHEDEVGNFPLADTLDAAMQAAADSGSVALHLPKQGPKAVKCKQHRRSRPGGAVIAFTECEHCAKPVTGPSCAPRLCDECSLKLRQCCTCRMEVPE